MTDGVYQCDRNMLRITKYKYIENAGQKTYLGNINQCDRNVLEMKKYKYSKNAKKNVTAICANEKI